MVVVMGDARNRGAGARKPSRVLVISPSILFSVLVVCAATVSQNCWCELDLSRAERRESE